MLSHLPSVPPQSGPTKPLGQRSFSTTARHRASVPYASRNCASLRPRTRDANLLGILGPHHGQTTEELTSDLLPFQATQVLLLVCSLLSTG